MPLYVREVNPVQPLKADVLIVVTVDGILILVKLEQFWKANVFMIVNPVAGKLIVVNPVIPLHAP